MLKRTEQNVLDLEVADPVLEIGEIQGDVLVGLQKKVENFVFFKIEDQAAFKAIGLRHLPAHLTTCEEALENEERIKDAKAAGRTEMLPIVSANMSLTHAGLEALLGAGNATGLDPSFTAGAAAQAAALLDPVDDQGNPVWLPRFASDTIHGVLLVTGPDEAHVAGKTREIVEEILGDAISVVYDELGLVRPDQRDGHEHFGFLDGVSQPGIRGLTERRNEHLKPDQGLPGQDLLWPGEFVFGYPAQKDDSLTEPGDEPAMAHEWMRNGAYMVFRRLVQRVPEFDAFLVSEGARLALDSELLGARMVGRWKSGAPLLISPLQDNPPLGADKLLNNDFEYGTDPNQRRCPYAAHIRKTYPRDDIDEVGVQKRRIIRAGIPFGPEVTPAEEESQTTSVDRGLMFVCYQTSIANQFEFIQQSWANNTGFVFGKTRPGGGPVQPGHDPIIGQANGARSSDEPVPNYPTGDTRSATQMPQPFVVPTAAAYFFTPSISGLRALCS